MGEVFLAQQVNLNRLVVIKQVLASRANDQHVRALLEEARVAARLHHPNVVNVLDVSRDGETPFVAMEYLAGVTLREMIERAAPRALPLEIALPITLDVLRGLAYAHGVRTGKHVGVVHRDIKPRNVMVTYAGIAKLIDFGISRWLGDGEAEVAVSGTRGYMAPEQHDRAVITGAADQYAVAVTLYEMVSGALPRGGDATQIDKPGVGGEFVARVPIDPELDAIIACALEVDPAHRWADCAAMAHALESLARRRGLPMSAADVQRWLLHHFPQEHEATEAESAGLAEEGEATRVTDGGATAPTNLAPSVDAFVGRSPELEELARRFADGARLVTLLGGPGIGKTRLAREYAWRARENYAGGAWFVDLTEARTLEGVVIGIAAALGVGGLDSALEAMLRQLGAAIAHRGQTLLVVDNFEQVVDHASIVDRLSALAPGAHWLVTSRERLNLPLELVIELGPLSGETDGEALALLIERARAARPGLALGMSELDELAVVIERLEGNPLAIELAAGRLKVLSPKQLSDRLASGFDVLTGRRRGVPERQTAFDKAVEWSWQMLEPWEQAALAQTGVFRGGFSVEAAEAVVDLSAHPSAFTVIDVLESLCDKSLLRRVSSPELPEEPRFGMYEGIRSFALGRLETAGTLAATRARHARYFLAYAEPWAAHDAYPEVRERANRLAAERENIWALVEPALAGAPLSAADAVVALRALVTLVPIYEGRGLRSLVLKALAVLLDGALVDGAPPAVRAQAWRERARAIARGHTDLQWEYLSRSLELARRHDLVEQLAWSIFRAVPVAADRKDQAARDALVNEALDRLAGDANRDWRAVATSLVLSFQMIASVDADRLAAILADVTATSMVSRRPSVLAQIEWALGVHSLVNGDMERARKHMMRVAALYEETGDDQPSLALARGNVAAMNLALDRELVTARNLAELSRRSLLEMGLPESVPFNDFNLALIREGLGDLVGAEVEARRCLDRQTAAGNASNWLMRGDTGRVTAAAQLAIALSQLGRVDEADAMVAQAFTWTARWTTDPPSSESVMEAARAILDLARGHCALARAELESLPLVLETARAHLAAAKARTQAAWSDEVLVIARRAQRRLDDAEASLFGAVPHTTTET
jgi:predicted ATPase